MHGCSKLSAGFVQGKNTSFKQLTFYENDQQKFVEFSIFLDTNMAYDYMLGEFWVPIKS